MLRKFTYFHCLILSTLLLLTTHSSAQTVLEVKKEKMAQISYMVGEWVGTSKTIQNDIVVKEVPAFTKMEYLLDSTTIELNLRSETLVLHTIIHYDTRDSTYYYQPFSKTGTGKYKAHFDGEKLIVMPNENLRYVFLRTAEGHFQEYGERTINGVWMRYFEDTFVKVE